MGACTLSITIDLCSIEKSGLRFQAHGGSRRLLLLLGFVALFGVCGSFAVGQSTGAVRGVVKDPAGAVLPNATVTLTNTGTDRKVQTTTNAVGGYGFTFLPPGDYRLTVDVTGFLAFVRDKIPVDVDGVAVIDATLQMGTTSQAVVVTGVPPQLDTTTSSLGTVVDDAMMQSIPLSSRNFTQILTLSPGVTANVVDAGALGRNSVNISANGGRPWDNNIILNGMDADNPMSQGFDDAPDKTGTPVPSPDAIEEFKVQTGLYDAEFGKEGGGTVNIVTKSGTNKFHGSAFEFFRNTALDANGYFQNATGSAKPVFRQNQYGGTLGGPIIKDRVFFFGSYQGTNQANAVSSSSNITTFLPVLGDRSAQALGGLWGGQTGVFGGVPIAANGSNINPVALALVNAKLPNGQYAIPAPQVLTSATVGYSSLSAPAIFNENQYIANGDVTISSKQTLSFKSLYSRDPESLPFQASTNVLGFGENDYHSNLNLALSYTYTLSSSMVNELRIGYSRNYVNQVPVNPFSASSLGMVPPTQLNGTPSFLINGLFNLGTNRNNNQLIRQHEGEISDTLSKSKGRHQLRFGGDYEPVRTKYADLFVQEGELDINSFPDLLLGMSSAQNGTPQSNISQALGGNGKGAVYPAMNNFSLFVQDDFQVNTKLTLNLGLRYQFSGQPYNSSGEWSNFDFRLYPQNGPPAGGTLSGLVLPANVPSSIQIPAGVTKLGHNTLADGQNWLGLSPRVGFSWRPLKSNNFVVRGGYGIFWSTLPATFSIGVSEEQPFYYSVITGGATNPNVTLQNPFPGVPALSAFPIYTPLQLGSNPVIYPFDPSMKLPHTQQYSGNVQQEFKGVLFQVGYVGSQTTNIGGFVQDNQAGLASSSNPIHGQTTNSQENVLLRVPFIGFGPGEDSIGMFRNTYCTSVQSCLTTPYGGKPFFSHYNSAQFSVTKRYSKGLAFTGAYTFSRTTSNIDGYTTGRQQSLGGPSGDYHDPLVGTPSFARSNVFSGSYVYDLPKFGSFSGLRGGFVNGWSVSGVVIVESGLPYNITDSRAGTILGISGTQAQFASGMGTGNLSISNHNLNHWFNTNAFTTPPVVGDGTGIGNTPWNFATGPGFWNTDFALAKQIPLTEVVQMELRGEYFNLFNHPNFANPSSNLANPSSFGVVSNTISSPRIAQIAARIRF
jgi:Carboxypeptidase regulatory-like domain/TonB-dependent Receptor Plug Domain